MGRNKVYFYTAKETFTGYRAVVYHYENGGRTEVNDYTSGEFLTREAAIDRAVEWCSDRGIDGAEME